MRREEEVNDEQVTFYASIATGPTAWRVSGDSPPTARLVIEIPATEIERAMRVMLMGQRPLRVTIVPE